MSCDIPSSFRLLLPISLPAHHYFFSRSVRIELPEVTGAPTVPALNLSVVCSSVWERAVSSTRSWHSFPGSDGRPVCKLHDFQPYILFEGFAECPLASQEYLQFYASVYYPVAECHICSPRVVQEVHGGPTDRWQWKSPAGIHHRLRSEFSIDCGTYDQVLVQKSVSCPDRPFIRRSFRGSK